MPREVILYNPEGSAIPHEMRGHTINMKYEALQRETPSLQFEIHHFKSKKQFARKLSDVFSSHESKFIDKLVIDTHGTIRRLNPTEGVMLINRYEGHPTRHGDTTRSQGLLPTELSTILNRIESPRGQIPTLRLICCHSGLLSAKDSIGRTFLRSNLFNHVIAEDMVVSVRRNKDLWRLRFSKEEAERYFNPRVKYTPDPNRPTPETKTFLKYCAPNGGFRQTEGTVVLYHARSNETNELVERWDNYSSDLPFDNLSSHWGKDFPPYVI